MMRITGFIFVISVAVTLATRARSAEVTLRERAVPTGAILRLCDVAEVAPSLADELIEELAATPLMPAPADATAIYLPASKVRDLLAARGIDVRRVRLLGAESVQIGGDDSLAPSAKSSEAPANRTLSAQDSLREMILAYLREQTGHQDWQVEVAESDLQAAGKLGADTTITGGRAPWTGYQRFRIRAPEGARSVLVSVKVDRVEIVAVARRAIERGNLIGAADVELKTHVGSVPTQAARSLETIVGQEAVQSIRPGAPVLSNQVRAPLVVRRGERVSIRARAAGVTVRTFATAEQDGSLGDLVMVQNSANKERFAGRVTGVRELEVFTAGAAASDVAGATTIK